MISGNEHAGSGPEKEPAPWDTVKKTSIPDTSNQFSVCGHNGTIVTFKIATKNPTVLANSEAVNLAAWLCALADPERKEFDRVFKEISKPK